MDSVAELREKIAVQERAAASAARQYSAYMKTRRYVQASAAQRAIDAHKATAKRLRLQLTDAYLKQKAAATAVRSATPTVRPVHRPITAVDAQRNKLIKLSNARTMRLHYEGLLARYKGKLSYGEHDYFRRRRDEAIYKEKLQLKQGQGMQRRRESIAKLKLELKAAKAARKTQQATVLAERVMREEKQLAIDERGQGMPVDPGLPTDPQPSNVVPFDTSVNAQYVQDRFDPSAPSAERSAETSVDEGDGSSFETTTPTDTGPTSTDDRPWYMSPWLLGGLALGAVAYFATRSNKDGAKNKFTLFTGSSKGGGAHRSSTSMTKTKRSA